MARQQLLLMTAYLADIRQVVEGACHGGAANNATSLDLDGPKTVRTGETHDYSFIVAHRDQDAAGMNIAFRTGADEQAGELTAGATTRGGADQLTHTQPLALVNREASFDFEWKAPDEHGIITFRGAGNAVDDNGAANNDVWNTFSQQITVKGATITSPEAAESFCKGGTINITWTQTGLRSIRIEISDDNFVTFDDIVNSVDAEDLSYSYTIPEDFQTGVTYRIRLIDIDGEVELDRSGVFVIAGGPTILTQPEDVTVCEEDVLRLTIAAVGDDITYQWRKNEVNIPNADESILRITNVAPAQAGEYDCVVSSCGVEETSETVTVVVNELQRFNEQPSSVAICGGEVAEFTVSASGTNTTYQWFKDGVPLEGETTRRIAFEPAALADEGKYVCVISGDCEPDVASDTAFLNIIEPPTITEEPSPVEVMVGEEIKLSVSVTGEELTFEWRKNGATIADTDAPEFVIGSASLSDSGFYHVLVYNRCDTVLSVGARVTVNPADGPGELALSVDTLDVGAIALCATADTVIAGLLQNIGTLELEVPSASVVPAPGVTINDPSFPLRIEGGALVDASLSVTSQQLGAFEYRVIFGEGDDAKTLVVRGEALPILEATPDTLWFTAGVSGETKCIETVEMNCPSVSVTSISVTGSYTIIDPPSLPVSIAQGETLSLCVQSNDTSSAPAALDIESDAGDFSIPILREVVSSVEEQEATITGLTVAPNPMREYIIIESPSNAEISMKAYSVMGSLLATQQAPGGINWDGRDESGRALAPGVYVLHITQGRQISIVKVVIER